MSVQPTTTAQPTTATKAPKAEKAPKVAASNVKDAIKAAKANTLTGAALDAAKAALTGLTQSSMTSDKGHWQTGIPFGTYSECFKEDGSLDTFQNNDKTKVSGRWIMDKGGRRFKLYNVYLRLLNINSAGFNYIPALDFLSIEGASFGVKAEEDTTAEKVAYGDKEYYPIVHSLIVSGK